MVIGQFFSKKINDKEKLDFEMKNEELGNFNLWMTCTIEIDDKGNTLEESQHVEVKKEKKILGKASKTIVKSFRFLRDSLQLLKSGEDADPEKIELAMASFPSLIMTASEMEISNF